MEKKRLDYLDMVKGFGIFLVVLGHMEDISSSTRIWISSLHMPLFFIVSGILIAVKNEQEKDMSLILKKRFKGLIIPYLWFSLSYFLIDILNVTIIGNIDLHTFIVDTISSLTFYGMSVLWFLPALFISTVTFLFLKKKLSDKVLLFVMIIISVVSYLIKLQFELIYAKFEENLLITSLINIVYIVIRALVALSFVGYAFYIKKLFDSLVVSKNKYKFLDGKIFSFICGIILLGINIPLAFLNNCVDLRNILLNNVPIYYIAAFAGSFGLILLFKGLPSVKLITYFGKNSIIVMADHVNYYFLYAGIKLAWLIDPFVKHAKHYIFVAIVVTTIFILSTIVIEVINRWFPFVLGKGKK